MKGPWTAPANNMWVGKRTEDAVRILAALATL
jgi:hypothetical protein